MKEEFNKDRGNLREKNQVETLEIKSFLKSNKKYRGKPLQHIRTCERQNLRT
jgi:hypothetical protein